MNLKTAYIRRGEGKDLVFFHGYGANKECFLPQINYFSRFYRVTAFDFPAFGESDDIPMPWSVGDYARYTEDFLDGLALVEPYVLAHSFGARVAIKMAASGYPFEKMVLTGGAGIILNRNAAYRIKVKLYRAVKKLFPEYAERRFGSEEYRALSPVRRESYKKIVNEDLREDAQKVAPPVLLLYGERDKTTPVKAGEIYRDKMPNAELCVLKNCGHFAFLDDAVLFNRTMEEFLER